MENNKYPETLKIELVKRYLNGEQKVKICREYGIAKSTMWGWICKYQGMILKEWEIEGIEPDKNSCYVDIRKASEQVFTYKEGCSYFTLFIEYCLLYRL